MSTCCLCGAEGTFQNRDLSEEFESPLCDSCNWTIYVAKKDPSSDASIQNIKQLAQKPTANKQASEYLLNMFDPETIKKREEMAAAREAMLAEDLKRVEQVVKRMPITSSGNFEGYRIVRYGGYVSGDEVVTLSDHWLAGGASSYNKDNINNAIKQVRQVAIHELKQAAALIDCNAVIALDFDYINIDRQIGNTNFTSIILTANGTAVEIEPL